MSHHTPFTVHQREQRLPCHPEPPVVILNKVNNFSPIYAIYDIASTTLSPSEDSTGPNYFFTSQTESTKWSCVSNRCFTIRYPLFSANDSISDWVYL